MARILFATVPLSGHVNPGIPLARALSAHGHEVCWYCGSSFRDSILATGARFIPFDTAPEFNDQTVARLHGPVPTRSLTAHAGFYIRYVFFNPMPSYYSDLKNILETFDADLMISDEWFSGGIPFSEKKIKPWIIYGNSPLMMQAPGFPLPGSGLMPDSGVYGKHRDAFVSVIAWILLAPLQRYINRIRKPLGLPDMKYYFFEQNLRLSTLCLKFNTPAFEFPFEKLPQQLHFVGPMLPEHHHPVSPPWLERVKNTNKPVILVTQGSVDIYDIHKLIIPALKALHHDAFMLLVSTGGKNTGKLKEEFKGDHLIIESFIPYPLVMPFLDLMITNGGFGGVSAALSFGVPLIVAGNSEDKPEVASRVVYSGTGIDLKTGRPTARQIKKAVERIFSDPSFKAAAGRIRDDYRKHNAVEECIQLIESQLKITSPD